MISIVAAMDEVRGIGKENKIPWHLKGDLVHLKNLTKDQVVVLGRKTFESMASYYNQSGRLMPGNTYIVVTRQNIYNVLKNDQRNQVVGYQNLEGALSEASRRAEQLGLNEIFIIGGGQIFKEAIEKKLVDCLHLTIVHGNFECDTFFPDYSEFKNVVFSEKHTDDGLEYEFIDLTR